MSQPLRIPSPLGHLLSRLPSYPGSWLFVTALNALMAPQLTPELLAMLQGKQLRLHVTDAQLHFDFQWRSPRFVPVHAGGAADLTISASAHDFMLLGKRAEDPDTLFFNRRLAMEGDTELGLMLKNTMDGIELPVFGLQQLTPSALLRQWAHLRAAR